MLQVGIYKQFGPSVWNDPQSIRPPVCGRKASYKERYNERCRIPSTHRTPRSLQNIVGSEALRLIYTLRRPVRGHFPESLFPIGCELCEVYDLPTVTFNLPFLKALLVTICIYVLKIDFSAQYALQSVAYI